MSTRQYEPPADPVFESTRLIGRRWVPNDVGAVFAVYSNEDVIRWVGDGQPITKAQSREWMRVTEQNYRDRGYGMFALQERASGETIGFCGLVHPGGQAVAEVKYALRRSSWGRGYASEILPKLLEYGATQHGLSQIIATIAPQNKVSARIAVKAGMVPSHTRENDDGTKTEVYVWTPASP